MRVQRSWSPFPRAIPGPLAVLRVARGMAAWSESRLPWPLSVGSRLWRWSLDVVLGPPEGERAAERRGRPPRGRPAERRAGAGERARTAAESAVAAPGDGRVEPAPRARLRTGSPAHGEPRSPRGSGAGATAAARAGTAETQAAGAAVDIAAARERAPRDVAARRSGLYTRDAGEGPAVLLLHAFPLNGRMWEPQIEALRSRHRVLAPDLPGFGLSWIGGEPATIESYARQVALGLEQLGVGDVVVVGLSMGGYVALRMVETLGHRLRGLVLADTRSTADDEAAVARRHELAAEVEAEGVGVAVDALLPRLLGRTTQGFRPELMDQVRALALESSVAGTAAALRAMAARPDTTRVLSRVACPVVCIVGDEDEITPPETALAMASRLADASVEVLPRVGHLSSLEAPEAFSAVLGSFLDRVYASREPRGL